MKDITTVLIFYLILTLPAHCFTQQTQHTDSVKLINWNATSCEHSLFLRDVVTRISSIDVQDSITTITISFSENCCADFAPYIALRGDSLCLFPFQKYIGGYCNCNCCFSIQYEISGLIGKDYQTFFQDKKVVLSDDHYPTQKPTYDVFEGKIINRKNKYGFQEGLWIGFRDDGSKESEQLFPESSLYDFLPPIYIKLFHPSGSLSYYSRGDTTEGWFENGELAYKHLEYTIGDTAYELGFRLYDNRRIKRNFLEKRYSTYIVLDSSTMDSCTRRIRETVYREENYEDGQAKRLFRNDTTFSWYPNGQLHKKEYQTGRIEFDEQGKLLLKEYSWVEKGADKQCLFNHSLYVHYYLHGKVSRIHYVRDRQSRYAIHYDWIWDTQGKLCESPKDWNEPLPWERFEKIKP